jgi:hypothetical protein
LLKARSEESAESRKDKAVKVSTAHDLSVPAVNSHGGFGCREFLAISDPCDAANTIRKAMPAC